jgi:hypothetical protein
MGMQEEGTWPAGGRPDLTERYGGRGEPP